jgi:hypothetical protein
VIVGLDQFFEILALQNWAYVGKPETGPFNKKDLSIKCRNLHPANASPGLPDGVVAYQKSKLCRHFEWKMLFYIHLCKMANLNILRVFGIHIIWPFGIHIIWPFGIHIIWPFSILYLCPFAIFYGHLVYFMAIWYILWPFGIFFPVLIKVWQPCVSLYFGRNDYAIILFYDTEITFQSKIIDRFT